MAWILDEYSKFHGYSPAVVTGTVNGTVGDNKMAIVNSLANQDVEISLLDLNPKTRYTLHEKPVEPLSPVEPPKAEERAQVIIDNVYEIIITGICRVKN
ncbi:hypothetical protein DCAR_0623058 [Daucus carota subsp. sativus]|uniref:Uncharacterized protein n=1 Tax=Daucus carota subsp. sativus TaxID=79200 RepID=A0AAF0XAX1_DAUCS|nr:PREDICTED: uncharacterized protein LOC108225393 isoform X2 [Daucus carota subsp. sativus]WOH03659.1 hypothetical protein DCAR_0623058 [Daucus carota subsp. sativus]